MPEEQGELPNPILSRLEKKMSETEILPIMPYRDVKEKIGNELFRHYGAYKKAVLDIIMKKYDFGSDH